jgi:hypothetical protein
MTTMAAPIMCPVCGSHGSMLHHDIRSSLVYSCLNCTHEWQIAPGLGAAATEPATIEHPPARAQAASASQVVTSRSERCQGERTIFYNWRY